MAKKKTAPMSAKEANEKLSKQYSAFLPIAGLGILEENSLHIEAGKTKGKTIVLRTPGTIAKATNHQRQYIDILARETEAKTGVPIAVRKIVVPPSKHPTTIVLDVDHFRLLLLEAIEFPKNGKYAKAQDEKPLPKKKASAKKKIAK